MNKASIKNNEKWNKIKSKMDIILGSIFVLLIVIGILCGALIHPSEFVKGDITYCGYFDYIGDIGYDYDMEYAVLYAEKGTMPENIVERYSGRQVTGINGGFYNRDDLVDVTIPEFIEFIGYNSFAECDNLTSIKLPKHLRSIYGSAFQNCTSLKSIELPYTVRYIGDGTFWGCTSLESISLPNITTIDRDLFYNCTSLESIDIPNTVDEIRQNAFENCTSLRTINFEGNVADWWKLNVWNVFNGTPSDLRIKCKDGTLDSHGHIIGDYIVPKNVIDVESYEFELFIDMTTVTLPNIMSIGYRGFAVCTSLTVINISETIKSIGAEAFAGCEHLTTINYAGTMAEWKNVGKVENAFFRTPENLRIVCLDGVLDKYGNAVIN